MYVVCGFKLVWLRSPFFKQKMYMIWPLLGGLVNIICKVSVVEPTLWVWSQIVSISRTRVATVSCPKSRSGSLALIPRSMVSCSPMCFWNRGPNLTAVVTQISWLCWSMCWSGLPLSTSSLSQVRKGRKGLLEFTKVDLLQFHPNGQTRT